MYQLGLEWVTCDYRSFYLSFFCLNRNGSCSVITVLRSTAHCCDLLVSLFIFTVSAWNRVSFPTCTFIIGQWEELLRKWIKYFVFIKTKRKKVQYYSLLFSFNLFIAFFVHFSHSITILYSHNNYYIGKHKQNKTTQKSKTKKKKTFSEHFADILMTSWASICVVVCFISVLCRNGTLLKVGGNCFNLFLNTVHFFSLDLYTFHLFIKLLLCSFVFVFKLFGDWQLKFSNSSEEPILKRYILMSCIYNHQIAILNPFCKLTCR